MGQSLRSTLAQIESNNISIVSTDCVIEQCKILNKKKNDELLFCISILGISRKIFHLPDVSIVL